MQSILIKEIFKKYTYFTEGDLSITFEQKIWKCKQFSKY